MRNLKNIELNMKNRWAYDHAKKSYIITGCASVMMHNSYIHL